ncbi:hypothetical protein ACIRP3_43380 [Streptomyces sp. NPDC101209]|uniref:hypothetical protein n=1 Tax=Streptomyces sp. NPDC101209 TaxID=3366129 RepID=UPI003811A88E
MARFCSALLIVGEVQMPVEVELAELASAGDLEWGGLLRDVPEGIAAAICRGEDARLHLPDGQEHQVHPAGTPRKDTEKRLLVPFLGEGTTPDV